MLGDDKPGGFNMAFKLLNKRQMHSNVESATYMGSKLDMTPHLEGPIVHAHSYKQ